MDIVLLFFGIVIIIGTVLSLVLCRSTVFTLRRSYALPITALLAALTGCTICFLARDSLFALLLSLAFLAVGTVLLMGFAFWKISYTEDTFAVHSLLRGKKEYSMWDVTGITEGPGTTLLHLQNGTKIRIHTSDAGDFVDAVETHYRTVQKKGFALPDIPPKLFHGYLQNPGQFVFVFCMVLVLELCAVFTVTIGAHSMLRTPDELTSLHFSEFRTTLNGDTLEIRTDALEQPFTCSSFYRVIKSKGESAEDFFGKLNQQGGITVSVSSQKLHKAYAGNCKVLTIYELSGDMDGILLHQKEINAARRANYLQMLFTMVAIFVLTLIFVGFFCYVLSNAPRYPRLSQLLVKKEWLNI